jgi:hypothetical protein
MALPEGSPEWSGSPSPKIQKNPFPLFFLLLFFLIFLCYLLRGQLRPCKCELLMQVHSHPLIAFCELLVARAFSPPNSLYSE